MLSGRLCSSGSAQGAFAVEVHTQPNCKRQIFQTAMATKLCHKIILFRRVLVTLPCKPGFFASGGREKFVDFIFTKQISHNYTRSRHLVFAKVKGRIWFIHLQRTTEGRFFEDFIRATLTASCLRSRMESTNTVSLVLALTCLGPRSYLHTRISFSVSRSLSRMTSPHFNQRLSSRSLNPT